RTHAYIARREYMKALQRRWGNATVHIDWLMKDWQHQQIVYAPDPWLIGQAGGRSDIRGAEKPSEWWTSARPSVSVRLPNAARPLIVLRTDKREVAEELCRRGWHLGYNRDERTGYDNGRRAIATKTDPAERKRKLKEWANLLWKEAETAGMVVALWHPEIPLEDVQAVWFPVYEIHAQTPQEAEEQLPEPWRTSLMEYLPPNQPPIVLLNAPSETIQQLQDRGWHCVEVPGELVDQPILFRRWVVGQLRQAAKLGKVLTLFGEDVEQLPLLPERIAVERLDPVYFQSIGINDVASQGLCARPDAFGQTHRESCDQIGFVLREKRVSSLLVWLRTRRSGFQRATAAGGRSSISA
ncbi:MAG: hypothetical protein NZ602_10390, partial [Thermoguttaceae bacterium]|nr:hypothetical protein [Thermoguttaceae bacterium]